MRTKVFISFHTPFDLEFRNRLVLESNAADSAFIVCGWSALQSELRSAWDEATRLAIQQADVVVVLVGGYTKYGAGVRDELAIAASMGKRIIGIRVDEQPYPPAALARLHEWGELGELLSGVLCE